jgi:hypothetical protein
MNMSEKLLKRKNTSAELINKKNTSAKLLKRKDTLVKKAHELSKIGPEVAVIMYHNGKYSTYMSTDRESFPPSREQMVCMRSGFL